METRPPISQQLVELLVHDGLSNEQLVSPEAARVLEVRYGYDPGYISSFLGGMPIAWGGFFWTGWVALW